MKEWCNKAGGYKKLQFCGSRVASDSLAYFWIDTCIHS